MLLWGLSRGAAVLVGLYCGAGSAALLTVASNPFLFRTLLTVFSIQEPGEDAQPRFLYWFLMLLALVLTLVSLFMFKLGLAL